MGHAVSDDARRKLADAARGEKSYFYKDGRSSKRRRFYRDWRWRRQAERVKERDNRTCQGCGWTESEVRRLDVHHIDPISDSDQDPFDYPDDLLATLCEKCHSTTEYQDGDMKYPVNGRGEDARLDRIENPRWKQETLD